MLEEYRLWGFALVEGLSLQPRTHKHAEKSAPTGHPRNKFLQKSSLG